MRYLPNSLFAVPFVQPLKENLHPDGIIAVYGVVLPEADRFVLNLLTGPDNGFDHALHLSFRYPDGVTVLNSKQGGSWQEEQRVHHLPVPRGEHFQMLIYVKPHKFKVAFNGVHFADFHHRLPLEMVSHVGIEGDVHINTVTGVRTGFEPDNVVTNPENPFVQNIGGIFPGRMIRIRGNIPHDAYRFTVNLMDGPDHETNNIPFHASVRPNSGEFLVELNSQHHGNWDNGHQIRPCPVRPGQSFEMIILVDEANYKIAFNGQHFAEFSHRIPLQDVSYIRVDGSVNLTKISYEGQPKHGGLGFIPMPPPAEDYFHPHAYEAVGTNFAFANPYPIY